MLLQSSRRRFATEAKSPIGKIASRLFASRTSLLQTTGVLALATTALLVWLVTTRRRAPPVPIFEETLAAKPFSIRTLDEHIYSEDDLPYFNETTAAYRTRMGVALQVTRPSTIFVSIGSFRDDLCQDTIASLFARARNPARVFVGVVDQMKPWDEPLGVNETLDMPCESKVDAALQSRIRVVRLNARSSKGPTHARYIASKLWSVWSIETLQECSSGLRYARVTRAILLNFSVLLNWVLSWVWARVSGLIGKSFAKKLKSCGCRDLSVGWFGGAFDDRILVRSPFTAATAVARHAPGRDARPTLPPASLGRLRFGSGRAVDDVPTCVFVGVAEAIPVHYAPHFWSVARAMVLARPTHASWRQGWGRGLPAGRCARQLPSGLGRGADRQHRRHARARSSNSEPLSGLDSRRSRQQSSAVVGRPWTEVAVAMRTDATDGELGTAWSRQNGRRLVCCIKFPIGVVLRFGLALSVMFHFGAFGCCLS